jgi:hypothetical protein
LRYTRRYTRRYTWLWLLEVDKHISLWRKHDNAKQYGCA